MYLRAQFHSIRSFLYNIILGIVLLIFLFNTGARSFVLSGLLYTGLYHPDIAAISYPALPKEGDVRFTDAKGNQVALNELKGKVVFLNFWATWCPPCRAEMPSVNKLYQKYATDQRVVFLLVDADGNFRKSQAFLNKRNFDMPLYAVASTMPRELYSGSLPTTVVLDQRGTIVFRHEGMADYGDQKFNIFLDQLLK
jgi:thiol-disulfide isomerase/thioredoxin